MHREHVRREKEGGFMMLVAMLATLIPLFLVVGTTTQTMVSRQSRLRAEVDDERSFAAAESGIDYCIYRASTSLGLTTNTTYTRDLGDGMSYSARATYLRSDTIDNDGDSVVDEADENVYRVVSSGTFRGKTRRVVAYLGPVPTMQPVQGALSLTSSLQIQVQEVAGISGIDININGTAGPGPNKPGMAVRPPKTVANGISMIEAASQPKVVGNSPAPSVALGSSIDWAAAKTQIQNTANWILNTDSYKDYNFGNGSLNNFKIIYRAGKVQFQGTTRGAGIMYVDGDLQCQENFRFDGIVYVKGKIQMQGNARIYGAVICDTNDQIQLQVGAWIRYSSDAITKVSTLLPGKFVAFNGWQEISRN